MSDGANSTDDSGSSCDGKPATTSVEESVTPSDSNSAPAPLPTLSRQDSDSMLTDCENTNNENRVIEMESAAGGGGGIVVSEAVAEPIDDDSSEQPSVAASEKCDPDKHAEHISYDDQGVAIYTDPKTEFKYCWSKEKNEWVPASASGGDDGGEKDPYENEHYRWCHESKKWIPKENPKETEHYRWCDETNQWIPKAQPGEDRAYSYIDGVHHYTEKDGTVYFWDGEKKAWFPKVDDDFMAVYQLNYGFTDNTSAATAITALSETKEQEVESNIGEEQPVVEEPKPVGKKRKAPPEPPKWFDLKPEHNTKVYVTNLPLDITEEEFGEIMGKCGMVLKDGKTNKLKLKLYRDSNGALKGDGLCHYIKIESVELALNILDNYDVRGHKIRVQQAEFQLKGEYNPALKPKLKKKEKEKARKMQEALFDWRPEKMRGERSKHERIVIVKNLFEPELFDREVHLLLEYQNDLREECNKCGTCRRVVLFDRHPEGVAQITMSDPEEADLVVKLLHGRFFGKRKLTAEIWDGRTKYRIAETDADVNKRLDSWEKYLDKAEEASDKSREAQKEADKRPVERPSEKVPSDNNSSAEKTETGEVTAEDKQAEEKVEKRADDDDGNDEPERGDSEELPSPPPPQPLVADDDEPPQSKASAE
ncbi:HIV Tat-specific factor 1 homolog [Toxorhynchites rutilus septentrionalis]|uniref:HIV Tat-specific factor 1 homolog n=1 Tax=Toxorhynchites rutilus septentrionalis TaxID=329112 RepID=UPI002479C08F|nr:HIV Tat-specific factor 1 homolog [Toxorhynchites rutilus septentrionalis]